ncbi:MAG: 2-oxoacid:acceptor oxidoreductase family protein, partial [Sandaracinaceae bacterium]|nr:2-oxoacid:acceptor oxidoreductase family protein [Sandaracinaceae bacterium]
PTTSSIAVLDRTKEPGALGEPLYGDVVTACAEAVAQGTLARMPRIVGGRYGLGQKELTPAMLKAVLDELAKSNPQNHFTIGIEDDVSGTSLSFDPSFVTEPETVVRAMFFGLGADGTVGANKNSIKIIGEDPDTFAQGYFVYDSKKSGSQTVSHLRFGHEPIRSAYQIQSASFIGVHQWSFLERADVLERASQGAALLVDSPYGPSEIWDALPRHVQETILDKKIALYVIDAREVARRAGLGTRTNTIMQTCFFAISGVLPREQAIAKIRARIEKTYGLKGAEVVRKNFEAVDLTLAELHRADTDRTITNDKMRLPIVPAHAPEIVRRLTAPMMEGRGDALPVSAMPVDGTYPSGTARWEKRNVSDLVPAWASDLCIQCGNCSL